MKVQMILEREVPASSDLRYAVLFCFLDLRRRDLELPELTVLHRDDRATTFDFEAFMCHPYVAKAVQRECQRRTQYYLVECASKGEGGLVTHGPYTSSEAATTAASALHERVIQPGISLIRLDLGMLEFAFHPVECVLPAPLQAPINVGALL